MLISCGRPCRLQYCISRWQIFDTCFQLYSRSYSHWCCVACSLKVFSVVGLFVAASFSRTSKPYTKHSSRNYLPSWRIQLPKHSSSKMQSPKCYLYSSLRWWNNQIPGKLTIQAWLRSSQITSKNCCKAASILKSSICFETGVCFPWRHWNQTSLKSSLAAVSASTMKGFTISWRCWNVLAARTS